MHQRLAAPPTHVRRWIALGVVTAAQFMFGVDAFIVNVAIPTIARDLDATPAQIEAVIAVYLIGYATMVVTGGRLGDLYGARRAFIAGVIGFTLTSLWCGLAQSGVELIVARLAQGVTAAAMVPQVLATIHVLFSDEARARAFAVYGVVLGLAGAAGFLLGGVLVTLDLGGFGWRAVFFVNGPIGIAIVLAALRFMPAAPRRPNTRLDLAGAAVLFAALSGVLGPLLFGRDLGWPLWLWAAMAIGVALLFGFLRVERAVAARGGMPLVDPALLADRGFTRGLMAVFAFFFANLSFYLVMTLFMQGVLRIAPLDAGLTVLPLAIAFVIASRHSAARARHRGARVLIEGCGVQLIGLAALALTVAFEPAPSAPLLAGVLVIFGYGQGMVMAPISSAVLATVAAHNAGSAAGVYGTTTQIANAAGVAAIGGLYFTLLPLMGGVAALAASLAACAASVVVCAACLIGMRAANRHA